MIRQPRSDKRSWEERSQRAEELAKSYPFAGELLGFYKEITGFQKALYDHLGSVLNTGIQKRSAGSLRGDLDVGLLLPSFQAFLSLVERVGSPRLAQRAAELAREGQECWEKLLTVYWKQAGRAESQAGQTEAFFTRAFLQPYAEYLADHTEVRQQAFGRPICPVCEAEPQVAVLRPEGYGAKRSLVCSLCLTEWDYQRIVCPACGEQAFQQLSVYTASEFEHVRVEACESCKTYIKTVDLTKNGLAIPVVDELATIPLDLWAQERGYTKLGPNLLGI